jgi:hypothetical protein
MRVCVCACVLVRACVCARVCVPCVPCVLCVSCVPCVPCMECVCVGRVAYHTSLPRRCPSRILGLFGEKPLFKS